MDICYSKTLNGPITGMFRHVKVTSDTVTTLTLDVVGKDVVIDMLGIEMYFHFRGEIRKGFISKCQNTIIWISWSTTYG